MKKRAQRAAATRFAVRGAQPAIVLTPHGHLQLVAADAADAFEAEPAVPQGLVRRLEELGELEQSSGRILFELGAAEPLTALPAGLGFWRDLGKLLLARLCALPPGVPAAELLASPVPMERLEALLAGAPLMRGGEYLTSAVLGELWQVGLTACQQAVDEADGSVAKLIEARAPAWHQVGRVHLHLAERKGDLDRPFAFLATYTEGLSARGQPRHLPLGPAVQDSSARGDRETLASLLEPVRRAASESPLIKRLLETGDLFHPLAWGSMEAYAFLKEVPALEQSGVIVKIPDWWKKRTRPQVQVTIGSEAPGRLGMDAMLDFSVELALGGESLEADELEALLASAGGLVLLRGQWVEAEPEKLAELLGQWRSLEAAAADGIGFAQSMRLLAGADLGGGEAEDLISAAPDWCTTVAGKWLRDSLTVAREGVSTVPESLEGLLHARLRGYQEVGVGWLHTLAGLGLGACLADDMGLGKTLQVLALLLLRREQGARPALLVVPASLLANWSAERAKFAPSLELLVAHPAAQPRSELMKITPAEAGRYDIVMTTYGTVGRLPWLADVEWDTIVLDEAQAIKNPGTQVSRAVKALSAGRRVALTGTPIENRAGDLWSLFDFLNPGLLGSAKAFGRFTKAMAKREHDRYRPLRQLVAPYILRRLKTDPAVAPDLPEKTEVRAHCNLTRPQAALYGKCVEELKRVIASSSGIQRRGIVLAAMLRFQQLCNHPSQWLGDDSYAEADSGKFQRVREICEAAATRQEKVLIFTRFREMTAPLATFLAGVFGRAGLVLHGGTPVKRRGELVAAFQEERGPPFFVLSLKAGGTGLNLTAANHVIHFDRWWNPAVEEQATDRAFRIGQTRNVLVHKLICRGTVEERVDELLRDKADLAAGLLGDGEAAAAGKLITELPDDELLALVALDINTALADA